MKLKKLMWYHNKYCLKRYVIKWYFHIHIVCWRFFKFCILCLLQFSANIPNWKYYAFPIFHNSTFYPIPYHYQLIQQGCYQLTFPIIIAHHYYYIHYNVFSAVSDNKIKYSWQEKRTSFFVSLRILISE